MSIRSRHPRPRAPHVALDGHETHGAWAAGGQTLAIADGQLEAVGGDVGVEVGAPVEVALDEPPDCGRGGRGQPDPHRGSAHALPLPDADLDAMLAVDVRTPHVRVAE